MQNRRDFFRTSFSALLASQFSFPDFFTEQHEITGKIVGVSKSFGHLLRSGIQNQTPTKFLKTQVAIIGSGISGLSAGWKFQKSGFNDFHIFELENHFGGNSASGKNEISEFPWGAHYLPLPTKESKAVVEILEDFGAIESYTVEGIPIYKKEFLTRNPTERLWINGKWQEGIFPFERASKEDLKQYLKFQKIIKKFQDFRDEEGKKAFAIPLRFSSQNPEILKLDKISMAEFLASKNLNSERLIWFVNYGMRDDYGGTIENVSAWAGIHYYASRTGRSGYSDEGSQLTWAEGNGWFVKNFAERLSPNLSKNELLFQIEEKESKVFLKFLNTQTKQVTQVESDFVVLALPKFVVKYLLPEKPEEVNSFDYSSWLVANLSVKEIPQNSGVKPSWDNVIFQSDSLGYVIATHQTKPNKAISSVLTYYLPFLKGKSERIKIEKNSWEDWKEIILKDLQKAHPEIEKLVTKIDVMIWGHGMIRPKVDFVWNPKIQKLAEPKGKIYFAHSDLSGISIFEEANYWGVLNAQKILEKLKIPFEESLK
ncbi:MAG: NAD(P)/FAD-dependent oxidoreductase [Calditrichaeota bacterium]|nr:MAG: NAD(P)/FAD-dependent oxidoreductase [Calditrichota bacterium]